MRYLLAFALLLAGCATAKPEFQAGDCYAQKVQEAYVSAVDGSVLLARPEVFTWIVTSNVTEVTKTEYVTYDWMDQKEYRYEIKQFDKTREKIECDRFFQ
jgi:ABC-type uncharacterized transport system auxiliary subunit